MSASARERLRRKLRKEKKDFLERHTDLKADDISWLTENYIEEICKESDIRCKQLDPLKAVDLVIDEMDDEAFDKFIKGVLEKVKARLDKEKKEQKPKEKTKTESKEESESEEETESESKEHSETETRRREEPIPA